MDGLEFVESIAGNGPAVEGVNVTRRSHPAKIPIAIGTGSSDGICPGGEEGMAQFLPVTAKDKAVPVAGFAQSRNHGFGKWVKSYLS